MVDDRKPVGTGTRTRPEPPGWRSPLPRLPRVDACSLARKERLALLIHAGLGWCGAPEVEKCS